MAERLRVGVAGLGMWGRNELEAFRRNPRCEVTWATEINRQVLDAAVSELGLPNGTTDYASMLAADDLDAVAVCTPPFTHLEYGVAALRAGKHVLVEKPMCLTSADAQTLVEEGERHEGLVLSGAVGRYSRLNVKFEAVKELIDAGKLGRVYYIHHRGTNRRSRPGVEYNPNAPWFVDRTKAGGGPLFDWGGYDLSFHLGLVGDPDLQSVQSFCINGLDALPNLPAPFTVEEHAAAMLHFDDGLRMYWERGGNAHCEVPHESIFYGTRGAVRLSYCPWDSMEIEHFWVADSGRGEIGRDTITVENRWEPGPGDTAATVDAFVNSVLDGASLPVPPRLELKYLRMIERVYEAAGW